MSMCKVGSKCCKICCASEMTFEEPFVLGSVGLPVSAVDLKSAEVKTV